jgi:hypothetical protein
VPQARTSREWPQWVKDVRVEGAHVQAAFSGQQAEATASKT